MSIQSNHLLAPLEVRLEVGRPQPVRVVDVAADLLALAVHVPNEDDGGQLAVSDELLSIAEGEQERRLAQVLRGSVLVSSFFSWSRRGEGCWTGVGSDGSMFACRTTGAPGTE